MKIHVALLSLAAALVLTTSADARDPIAGSPHMRPATAAAASFVSNAQQMSQVVRDLVRTLEQGNVVAYVHLALSQPDLAGSTIRFAGRSKVQRFFVINIGSDLPYDRQVALLGHELQHATEVSRTPWVMSQADLKSMLKLIGWRDVTQESGYETSAAQSVERQITRELAAAGKPKP